MEGEIKNQKPKIGRKPRKRVKLDSADSQIQEKKQNIHGHQQGQESDDSDSSSGWSSEVIQPAIKSMAFRPKRGTRMKQLLKGKQKKDQFWDKYQAYFGGDINKPDNQEDEEDYEASSSGRDQFDSDFDLTDSYVGKRGRKKGTKIKRRKRAQPKQTEAVEEGPAPPKARRGRKKKMPVESLPQQKSEILLKEEKVQITQKIQQIHNGDNMFAFEVMSSVKHEICAPSPQKQEELNLHERNSNGFGHRKNSSNHNQTPRSVHMKSDACPEMRLDVKEPQ